MFDFLTLCRALSDENRIRILMALRGRSLCVCQVTAFLDLSPSTTSKHLSILRQARLIDSTKEGRWVYYSLAQDAERPDVLEALAWMQRALADSPAIVADEARILAILEAEQSLLEDGSEPACFHSLEIHSIDNVTQEALRAEDATHDPTLHRA